MKYENYIKIIKTNNIQFLTQLTRNQLLAYTVYIELTFAILLIIYLQYLLPNFP